MEGCDELQVAIEMRLHGALDAQGAARLDEHLVTCEACRRFEAMVKRTERTMQGEAIQLGAKMDWDRIRVRVHQMVEHQDRLPRIIAISVVLLPLIGWYFGLDALIGAGVLFVVAASSSAFLAWQGQREAFRQVSVQDDMIEISRMVLDERVRSNRQDSIVALVLGVLGLGAAAVLATSHVPGYWSAFCGAVGVVGLGAAGYRRFVVIPRAERERAELD
jgi:hypothetical protein